MRSLKDRVLSLRNKPNAPLNRDISHPTVQRFYAWCQQQPNEVLAQDICTLRAAFLGGHDVAYQEVPLPPQESSELLGFRRALDGVSRSKSPLKAKTADQLLHRALQHQELLLALREHKICIPLLLAASPGDDRNYAAEVMGIDVDKEGDPQ